MTSHDDNDSKQSQPGADVRLVQSGSTLCMAADRLLVTWLVTLGMLMGGSAIYAPAASATDGLPPGVPVPSWAAHRFVHFIPPKSEAPFSIGQESPLTGPSLDVSPQVAGQNGEKLKYWGGPVQHEPQLYLLFWGNNFWNGHEPVSLYSEYREFYYGLEAEFDDPGEQSWQGILSQYYSNTKGPYVDAKIVGESKINNIPAPQNVTEAMLEEEITVWSQNGAHQNANTQMIVLTAPGTTFSSSFNPYCGYHSTDQQGYSYSLVTYQQGECIVNNTPPIYESTDAASHEFAESTTDPARQTAWAVEEAGNVEVADLCNTGGVELPEKNGRPGWWYVTKLWDDEGGNRCSLEDPAYPEPPPPSVETGAATELAQTEASVAGAVTPNGPDAHYYFEYGMNNVNENRTGIFDAGYGTNSVPVNARLGSLHLNTLYHYRLVAESWAGTTDGSTNTFTTLPLPPAVATLGVREVGPTTASFWGSINTEDAQTYYYFEYGLSEAYGSSTPEVSLSAAEGTGGVLQAVTNLTPSTTYYYRFVARNAGGVSRGVGHAMRTMPRPGPETEEPTGIGATEATLHGSVNPGGISATYHFEYWPTGHSSEVTSVPSTPESVGSGTAPVRKSYRITGLVPFGQYSYRIAATDGHGWVTGETHNFTASAPLALATSANPSGANESTLAGAACTSSAWCAAVGSDAVQAGQYSPLAERWNGAEWTVQTVPEPSETARAKLTAVACVSPSACTAVGADEKSGSQSGYMPLAETWNGTAWSVRSIGAASNSTNDVLEGTACVSAVECFAAGEYTNTSGYLRPLVEHWNAGTLEVGTPPLPGGLVENASLSAISCTAESNCMAVGRYFTSPGVSEVLVEHYNGSTWSMVESAHGPTPGYEDSLSGISCASSSSCVAVGTEENISGSYRPFAETWNGVSWTIAETLPDPVGLEENASLSKVSCASATACIATGNYYVSGAPTPLVERWNGAEWQVLSTTKPSGLESGASALDAASCSSMANCTTVGWYQYYHESSMHILTLVENLAPSWSVQTTPNPSGAKESHLVKTSCVSTTECIGVGSYVNSSGVTVSLAERWTGTSWALQTTPNPSGAKSSSFESVSCTSATACVATGEYTNSSSVVVTFAERWNGTEWTIQTTPNPTGAKESHLERVSCATSTACTAVGRYENSSSVVVTLAERWNGTSWTIQETPNPSGAKESRLSGVSCTSTSECIAVGEYTNSSSVIETLGERWNGTTWAIQTTPNPSGAVESHLNDISCTSPTGCAAAGRYENSSHVVVTLAERWNGTSWAIQETPNPSGAKESRLRAVTCASASECTTVGDYKNSSSVIEPLTEFWNGLEWAAQTAPQPSGAKESRLRGVSCASTLICVATGEYLNSAGEWLTLAERRE